MTFIFRAFVKLQINCNVQNFFFFFKYGNWLELYVIIGAQSPSCFAHNFNDFHNLATNRAARMPFITFLHLNILVVTLKICTQEKVYVFLLHSHPLLHVQVGMLCCVLTFVIFHSHNDNSPSLSLSPICWLLLKP